MKCPWCGKDGAGKCAEGTNPVRTRWCCDWRKGCGTMWEFGDDGSGFYHQWKDQREIALPVYFDGCLLIFGEEEI